MMKKNKNALKVVVVSIYFINFILALILYLSKFQIWYLIAMICWGLATTIQVITTIMDLKKKNKDTA